MRSGLPTAEANSGRGKGVMTFITARAAGVDARDAHAQRAAIFRQALILVGVTLAFTALTAVFFWNWIPDLGSSLIGPPEDNMQDFWNSWYATAAKRPDGFFFTNLIKFPEGTTLFYHSFAYPKVFAIAVLGALFGADMSSLVRLENLALLISFPISGLSAFLLVRHFTREGASALLGGFIFAFNPAHIEQTMHHMHVASIELLPLFVFVYLKALERKSLALIALAAFVYALNALLCWYYLFYVAYFVLFHSLYLIASERRLDPRSSIAPAAACLGGAAVLLSPILAPMLREALAGGNVYMGGDNYFVIDLVSYLMPPEFHTLVPTGSTVAFLGNVAAAPHSLDLVPTWPARILGFYLTERTGYLGVVAFGVFVFATVVARKSDARTLVYACLGALVFAVFASGSWLHIMGHSTIPMPDALLAKLPFFRNVRTPSRAIVFVYLFLAIGVGQAAAMAWRAGGDRLAKVAMACAALLIVLDYYPGHPLAMTPVACSPGWDAVRDDPEQGFGVLDLPSLPDEGYIDRNYYMMQQPCHGRPIVEGNTSREVVATLKDHLELRDLEAQRRQLIAAKVKYVVLHDDMRNLLFPWPSDGANKAEYRLTYPVVFESPEMKVLRVY